MIRSRKDGIVQSITDIEDRGTASVRLTVPVRVDQEELLTRIVRSVSSSRDKAHKKERITKATIIRAYIDALSTVSVDLSNISDEKVLLQRILEALANR
jgi:hypothetical protein